MPVTESARLEALLTSQTPFKIEDGKLKELTLWDRIRELRHSVKLKRYKDLCPSLTELLKNHASDPHEASKSPLLRACNRIARELKKEIPEDFAIELLAAKLAIPSSLFDTNEGFRAFAERAYLYNYLHKYRHKLEIDGQTIKILMEGKLLPWKEAYAKWRALPEVILVNGQKAREWLYGEGGLQKKDLCIWEKWEAYKTKKLDEKTHLPKWGGRYILQGAFMHGVTGDLRWVNEHSWTRLLTPEGKIFSIGKYRPRLSENEKGEGVHKTYFQSPDLSDFWPRETEKKKSAVKEEDETTFIEVEISKEKFELIKKFVEETKIKEGEEAFVTFGTNCTDFVRQIFEKAGFNLPTRQSATVYLYPEHSRKTLNELDFSESTKEGALYHLKTLAKRINTFFSNLLLLLFGKRIEKKLGDLDVKPIFQSAREFFTLDPFQPPRYVAETVSPYIERWRMQQEKSEEYRYKLPKEMIISSLD